MRKLIGFVLAPMVALVVTEVAELALSGEISSASDALFGAGFLYFVATLFGIPLVALFDRREITRARSYALGGAMLLLLFIVPIYLLALAIGAPPEPLLELLQLLAAAAIAGAAMGLTYWIIARPDRNSAADPKRVRTIFS
jgi:hypothetical protein